jgi:catechol 2,3-dioxygenase-like lactoylglutathione lyase family enzyme
VARLGRKPVRPGRVTIAMTVGTLGLFVISMAAGMGNWPFGAAGSAMLVVGVALLTTASMRSADKSYVVGTVQVMKVSEPPQTTDYGRCEMQVLVDAPGHPGQTVTIRDPRVPVNKWPEVGDTLPALVAAADARRIKIQWDRIGTYADRYAPSYLDDSYVDDAYTDELPALVEEDYVPEPGRARPAESLPLPRRTPASAAADAHAVAVLEGELIPTATPTQPEPNIDENVGMLDFSDLPEPERATPVHAGPAFAEDADLEMLHTKPNARPASAGSIHGVGITVLVTELARSLVFYRDLLGFYEIDDGPDTVILASGDTRVVLVSAQELEPVHRRLVHINLEVGDVEAVYQELKIRGVRFTYPPRVVNRGERLELVAAAFKDPDGHGIAITQWKARSA